MSHEAGDSPLHQHAWLEARPMTFIAALTVAVSIGGLVEMIPLFTLGQGGQASTLEARAAALVKPRSPLQLEGFDVYVREGCYTCHSQMVRPFRHETLRYGKSAGAPEGRYSLAADAQYDHPFQYGSRRIGPDLAFVGGKYPDDWHRRHLRDPKAMVPESLMPRYGWLEKSKLDPELTQRKLKAQRAVGVPYTDAEIAAAPAAVLDKTEEDALVAYLQALGAATQDLKYDEKEGQHARR